MKRRQPADNRRLNENDWLFIAICIALVVAAIAVVVRYFDAAFPQAAIEFRYDRNSSRPLAERFLAMQKLDVRAMKHAARFASEDEARTFLERELGLEQANGVMADDVHVWYWHHRWFQPLVEEEISVDVAPTGEIVGFSHHIPEDRAAPPPSAEPPVAFLTSIGVDVTRLTLTDTSERRLPKRIQRIFTWESNTVRHAGSQYRHVVTVDGNVVTSYSQHLKVPDVWIRSYREMRSKNQAAGSVDLILHVVLMIAAVVLFIVRMRRGDLPLRFLLGLGIVSLLLVGGVTINEMPAQLAYYDTTTSYPAFLGQLLFQGIVQSGGTAVLLIVICGAGEVLYRERLPKQLAMPLIWTRKSLTSKRVLLSMILGYALVPMFIAYQVIFYLTARKYGAWAPAEVPYDDLLNSALPWAAVMFAGFFPAFSEEFLSRAFSIPFIQRLVRWRWLAIVLAAFIWGFGHSTYPNQPFWIRGVEVGLAGIVAGVLMERFGLLPLLIWHYTIDAVYTATMLFASGNTYYVVSAALASLLFAVPLLVSLLLYWRNRGFVPDDDLLNAAMPASAPLEPEPESPPEPVLIPAAMPLTRKRLLLCVAVVIAAAIAAFVRPPSPEDVIDYRIDANRAKELAREHVGRAEHAYVVATPVEGFRSWDPGSDREEGGAPGGFDSIAATWLVRQGLSVEELTAIFRDRIEAGTWMVRFFTPMEKEEIFVEVDPRTSRVVGFHKYQDERNPAQSLSQEEALVLAKVAFTKYGVDASRFELKEALSFQQPGRRDWLFHFDEPLANGAFRRASVRVAGAEITQFNKTIKVPDAVYREATTERLLNVVLLIMKIAGMVTLLGLVIGGLIIATRAHGLPWRRALRWTLVLSLIPVAAFVARLEPLLFTYSTTIAWETFRIGIITSFVREIGMQAGVMFLALAGLQAARPYALDLLARDGRGRFGRSAVIAAITAVAILVISGVVMRHVAHAVPSAANVELRAPSEVALPVAAAIDAGESLFAALIVAAAIALFANAVPANRLAPIVIVALFCAAVEPNATPAQAPVMLLRVLLVTLLLWVVARYVLGRNPLAWPLAVWFAMSLSTVAMLLQNHRPDLMVNAIALVLLLLGVAIWMWRGHARVV